MQFFTIGVFNSTEQEFFNKLIENRIDTFYDIRQRRSIRGSNYSFANSSKLQEKLADLGIQYAYIAGLAPTQEIRDIQKRTDTEKHELITERQQLDKTFSAAYKSGILDHFDFNSLLEDLKLQGSKRIVLFCVEELAGACHRSLVAEKLHRKFQFDITNL